MTEAPDLPQDEHVSQSTADLLQTAETAWLELIAGDDRELRESLRQELVNSQRRLSEEGDTPLVRLLVRRVALCEIQAAHADATYARCEDVSMVQAKFLIERQRVMNQRLLRATKTLAEVRKLTITTVRRRAAASTVG